MIFLLFIINLTTEKLNLSWLRLHVEQGIDAGLHHWKYRQEPAQAWALLPSVTLALGHRTLNLKTLII